MTALCKLSTSPCRSLEPERSPRLVSPGGLVLFTGPFPKRGAGRGVATGKVVGAGSRDERRGDSASQGSRGWAGGILHQGSSLPRGLSCCHCLCSLLWVKIFAGMMRDHSRVCHENIVNSPLCPNTEPPSTVACQSPLLTLLNSLVLLLI